MFLLILLPKELCWLGASGQKKVDPLAKLPKWVLIFTCLKHYPSFALYLVKQVNKKKEMVLDGYAC